MRKESTFQFYIFYISFYNNHVFKFIIILAFKTVIQDGLILEQSVSFPLFISINSFPRILLLAQFLMILSLSLKTSKYSYRFFNYKKSCTVMGDSHSECMKYKKCINSKLRMIYQYNNEKMEAMVPQVACHCRFDGDIALG